MVAKAASAYPNITEFGMNEFKEGHSFLDGAYYLWTGARQGDIPNDALGDWFMEEVTWFLIYNIIIGAVTWIATYLSVFLFNRAAQNQVSNSKLI